MVEIEIATVPLDLGAALGEPSTGDTVTRWRLQNRGPATVYRTTDSATAPDPEAVRGFRHPSGSVLAVRIVAGMPTWVWTATGSADVIAEPAG